MDNIELEKQKAISEQLYQQLSELEAKHATHTVAASKAAKEISRVKGQLTSVKAHYKKMLSNPDLLSKEPSNTDGNKRIAGGILLGLLLLAIVLLFSSLKPKEIDAPDANLGAEMPLGAVFAAETIDSSSEQIQAPWWASWDEIQFDRNPLSEEELWAIDSHWEALSASRCDGNYMAAIWRRETGLDVTSNNPFQLSNPSPDASMEGFKADVITVCDHLNAKAKWLAGAALPEKDEINAETIGIYLLASVGYNGLGHGRDWQTNPYVTTNLDGSHTNLQKCAVDGCAYKVTDRKDGVFTTYLKLLRR